MRNTGIRKLTESAILLGLAYALSYVKIIQMPWGGAVTLLSMLPITIISIRHGLKWGISVAFLYALSQYFQSFGKIISYSQILVDEQEVINWSLFLGQTFLDYILAFTVLGFAGAMRKKGFEGQCLGIIAAVTLRFIFHFISGIILWGEFKDYYDWAVNLNVPVYSLVYNGIYMFPEILFTGIGAGVLLKMPYVRRFITSDIIEENNT